MADEKLVYSEEGVTVSLSMRGATAVLRFVGSCSPALLEWLPKGLREVPGPPAIKLRELTGIDSDFVREVARKKDRVALLDPTRAQVELFDPTGKGGEVVLLSGEGALVESGSIPDSLEAEKKALEEIAARFANNPLWRKVDQEDYWLCPLCGTLAEDVRVVDVGRPPVEALRGVRSHLMERCRAWRSGRTTPFPASMLDSFLLAINRRKSAAETERKTALRRQVETLQGRVESMEHLERSVTEAQRRQLHLIPVEPEPDDLVEIAVCYRPLESVGGDFVEFYKLEENRFGVAMGDVSGHGVEAAIIMGMAKMAMRARSQGPGSLRDLMIHANRDLFTELRRTAFVTGFFARIDRATLRMTYIRAGHPPPILRRASGRVEDMDGPGLPFGVDAGARFDAGLEEREVALGPGDLLIIYTDGVIEAGATEEFGMQRLRRALLMCPGEASAQEVLRAITGALDAFLAGAAASDDVTLVCIKIR